MDMKEIIINSIKYTASNWIKVLLLELVILMVDITNELSFLGGIADEVRYIVIVAGIILGIYQLGFIFRIIEETTHGSDKMPKFNRYVDTFIHGLKEVMITVIYFIIPFILVLMGVLIIDNITGPKTQDIYLILIIFGLFLASLTYLLYQAAQLNMANHHGTVKSAFDLKKIFKKVRVIGIKKLGFIYLLTVVFAFTVEITLADAKIIIPFGLGGLISAFLIAPFILIFIARTLGLINKTLET
jgi:hypothetical protein